MSRGTFHERQLADACVRGEPQAHRQLIMEYHRRVRQAIGFLSVARRGAVTPEDVEDAVQLAFFTFFANDARVISRWEGVSRLSTYLCKVAGRIAIHHFQRILTHGGRFSLELDAPLGKGTRLDRTMEERPAIDETLVQSEERERLRALILERLSDTGRSYYDWLFVQEMSVAEIVAIEKTTANNVYQWKNRISRVAHSVLSDAGYVQSTKG